MRKPAYDGCAADRTQAGLLQGIWARRMTVPLACDLARSGSNPGAAFLQVKTASRFTTAAPPIVRKRGSYKVILARRMTVGVPLACDLARRGSNPGAAFLQVKTASRFTTAAPPIARKRGSYRGFGLAA